MPSIAGVTNQVLPGASSDGIGVTGRLDRVIETELVPGKQSRIAGDGNYFRATNPTWGTTVSWAPATLSAFDSSRGLVACRHRGGAGLPAITLDYIRLTNCTPPTTTASLHFGIVIDHISRLTNTTSNQLNGNQPLTPSNANSASGTGAIAEWIFGNISVALATATTGPPIPNQIG